MGVAVWNTCQVCQKTINKNEISHEVLLANHHEFLLAPPEISFFDLPVAPCSYTLPINEHETTFGFPKSGNGYASTILCFSQSISTTY